MPTDFAVCDDVTLPLMRGISMAAVAFLDRFTRWVASITVVFEPTDPVVESATSAEGRIAALDEAQEGSIRSVKGNSIKRAFIVGTSDLNHATANFSFPGADRVLISG